MKSCFDTSNLIVLEGNVYERLEDHPTHEYRVILEYDHYDYIDDKVLITELDKEKTI